PCGAALRACEFAPGKFVEPDCLDNTGSHPAFTTLSSILEYAVLACGTPGRIIRPFPGLTPAGLRCAHSNLLPANSSNLTV
ncbi:hypothetical protein, partial [Thiolapillus sp.]